MSLRKGKHMDMGNFNLLLLEYFVNMRSFVLAFCNFALQPVCDLPERKILKEDG